MIDTGNKFLVRRSGNKEMLWVNDPQRAVPVLRISEEEALNLAAWLVALCPERRAEFEQALREIEGS